MRNLFLILGILVSFCNLTSLAQCILDCQDGPRANTSTWQFHKTGTGSSETAVTQWRMYALGPDAQFLRSSGNPTDDNTYSMQSPFFSTQDNVSKFYNYDFNQWDVSKEDGWEMLIRDFGFRTILGPLCNNQETEEGPHQGKSNPVVVFYNKYTGIMRVFILATQLFGPINEGNTLAEDKGATIQLSLHLEGGARLVANSLTALARTQTPADVVLPNQREITLMQANNAVSAIPYWYTADFPIAYDPCICAINQTANLKISLFLANETNFSLELNNVPIPGANGNGNTLKNTDKKLGLSSIGTIEKYVKDGGKLFQNFGQASSDLGNSISTSFPDAKFNFPSFKLKATKSASMIAAQKKLAFIPKVGPFVVAGIALVNFFSGFGKKSKSTASAIQYAGTTLTGSGKFTSFVELDPFIFKLPGAEDSQTDGVQGALKKPNWDNPMGILTLLETPNIRVETFDKVITDSWESTKHNCRWATDNPEEFKTGYLKQRIRLINPLKIAINPSAGFDITKSKIEACFEVENVVDYQSTNEREPSSYEAPDAAPSGGRTFYKTKELQTDEDGNNVTSFEREGLFIGPSPKMKDETGLDIYWNEDNKMQFPKYRSSYVNANYLQDYTPSIAYNYSEFYGFHDLRDCVNGRNRTSGNWYQKPVVYVKIKAKLVPQGATDPEEFTEWIGRFPTKLDPSNYVRINTPPPSPSYSDIAETVTIDDPLDCNLVFGMPSPFVVKKKALSTIYINANVSCGGAGISFEAPDVIVMPGAEITPSGIAKIDLIPKSNLPTQFSSPPTSEPLGSVASWCNSVYKNVPGRIITRQAVASNDPTPISRITSTTTLGYPIPNPTTGKSTIALSLGEDGPLEAYLSNSIGVQVKSLLSKNFAAAGKHSIDIDTQDLEAGVYFITVKNPGFSQARKLVVVK